MYRCISGMTIVMGSTMFAHATRPYNDIQQRRQKRKRTTGHSFVRYTISLERIKFTNMLCN